MTKRVLVIADMCTVGQCSLSVALPILSACGVEACPLPIALLSTHSVGFEGYSRNSMVDEAKSTLKSLIRTNMCFDAVFSMYLGGVREVRLAQEASSLLRENEQKIADPTMGDNGKLYPGLGGITDKGSKWQGVRIVDPAMGDSGELYPGLGGTLIEETATLVAGADVVTPNLTEACLLARVAYRERCDEAFLLQLSRALTEELGAKRAVITGVSFEEGRMGAYAFDGREGRYFAHRAEARVCHGAGDVFSSVLTGKLLTGAEFFDGVREAEAFTYAAILATLDDPAHFYGLHFEKCLRLLTK